ncbi:MAG: hypothetical protein CL571_03950 [Alphaproteobacteria bacterium]|jgi:hypothetical protein|nr:hypothetical protein [Alphaproteobacteria bacterium]|tara:strand:- start:1262 stop:1906 length:645 start_codon:yes stop_codon:yes gene_type:complete
MSEEFIKEVDEDIKEEKRIKLWKKLIPYVISFSLTIILFTSGFVFWKNYTRNSNQTLGDDFTAAVDLANEDDTDAALLALDRIVDKGSDGYATIAKMKKASLLIDKGLSDEGLSIYLDLERNAVDQSFRDIATILYVLNSMDKIAPETLLKKIEPLENSKVWQSSALELKAFIFLKNNNKKLAKETFQSILNLKTSPSSLSTRARNMVEYLKEE